VEQQNSRPRTRWRKSQNSTYTQQNEKDNQTRHGYRKEESKEKENKKKDEKNKKPWEEERRKPWERDERRHMRRFFAVLALFLITAIRAAAATDHIIISQALYDPIATETGGEAIELYNPTASPVDISGWVIKTASSATDATIGANTILEPGQYYLIADAGWSTSKDNTSAPDADHEEAITLLNTNGGAALMQGATVIDAVGWGDPAAIPADLYEGTPAAQVSAGKSLRRISTTDTDDNLNDFSAAEPDFHNTQTGEGQQEPPSEEPAQDSNITLSVTVTNSAPTISNQVITPDDDAAREGAQAIPTPAANTTITITATVSDENMQDTIQHVKGTVQELGRAFTLQKTAALNATSATYSGTFNLEFFQRPQNYTVIINATDNSNESTTETIRFETLRVTAIEIESATISFGTLGSGLTKTILGDLLLGTQSAPTIRNTGNTKVNLGTKGSGLSGSGSSIPVNSIRYSFATSITGNTSGTLSNLLTFKQTNLEPGISSTIPLSMDLTIPTGTKSGSFNGQMTVAATAS
jgi:hypothetical protein